MTHPLVDESTMLKTECEHFATQVVDGVQPLSDVCQDCGLDRPLRMCATCGYVGCCESRASHDTLHWETTGHALIRRLPLAEDSFTYCYEHKKYLK